MATTTENLGSKLNSFEKNAKSKLSDAEGFISDMSHKAGVKAGEVASDVAETAGKYVDAGKAYVKDNPFRGLAFAAGIGALVGCGISLLMRRKS